MEESLERLVLDRIDIVHIHDPDDHYEEALAGAFPALERLRGEGVIGAVGAGMNQVEMLIRFAREADFDCFLVAGRYTLLDQSALPELLPLCLEHEIAVIVGGVFNSGILAGGANFDYRPASPALRERAASIEAVCSREDVPLAAAALQFPPTHPAVASILLGPRSARTSWPRACGPARAPRPRDPVGRASGSGPAVVIRGLGWIMSLRGAPLPKERR